MKVVTLWCAAILSAGNLGAQGVVQQHLEAARKARAQKQYAEAEREGAGAVAEAEKIFSTSEVLRESLADLGLTYFTQQKFGPAEAAYRRAVDVGAKVGSAAPALASDLQSLGRVLTDTNHPADALPYLERAVSTRQKAQGPNHPDLAIALQALAGAQVRLLRFENAEGSLRWALQIQAPLTGRERLQRANTQVQLSAVLERAGKYTEEEPLLRQALQIREEIAGPNDRSVADALNELGEFLRHRARFPDAEPLYRRALAMGEKTLGHGLTGTLQNNLALDLLSQGKPEDAEALLLEAIDGDSQAAGGESAEGARHIANLSAVYVRLKRLPEAEKMASRALAIREKGLGADSPGVLGEVQTLANVYTAEKRFDQAVVLRKRALDIEEKTYGTDSPQIAGACHALGAALRSARRPAEAEVVYVRALSVVEKARGLKSLETATELDVAASFYRADARYPEAETLYRRALAIREASPGIAPEVLATGRNTMAVFLRDKGWYREAIQLLESATTLPIATESRRANIWSNLGELYSLEGRYAKAQPLLEKSVDSGEGTDANILARLRKLARVQYERKQYAQALPEYQQALSLAMTLDNPALHAGILEDFADLKRDTGQQQDADKLYGEAQALLEEEPVETPSLAHLLTSMAVSATRKRRFPEAEKLLLRARAIYERSVGVESALTANCLSALAIVYREQKRFAEAEPLFRKASEVEEKTIGPDAPVLERVLREYALLLRAMNRAAEAAPLEARAARLAQ